MTKTGVDIYGNNMYSLEIPADVDNIIFNDNKKNNQQTVAVKIGDKPAFYLTGGQTSEGKWKVDSISAFM